MYSIIRYLLLCKTTPKIYYIEATTREFLGVQWLWLGALTARACVQSLMRDWKSCKVSGTAFPPPPPKKRKSNYCFIYSQFWVSIFRLGWGGTRFLCFTGCNWLTWVFVAIDLTHDWLWAEGGIMCWVSSVYPIIQQVSLGSATCW